MSFSVLIVDDEYYICESLKTKLHNLNFPEIDEIRVCYSGEEAMDICKSYSPSIVITDIKMENMSGIDLIRELKKTLHPVRFLVLSGYDDYEYIRSAFQTGASDYLLKPILSEPLAAVISEQLRSLKSYILPEVNSRQSASFFAQRVCRYLQDATNDQRLGASLDQLNYPNCRFVAIGWESQSKFILSDLLDRIYEHFYECPEVRAYACSLSPNKIYVLTNAEQQDPDYKNFWEKLLNTFASENTVRLAIGISSCKSPQYLRMLFYEAENLLSRRLKEGYGQIYTGKCMTVAKELPPGICKISKQLLAKPELVRDEETLKSFSEQLHSLSLLELNQFYNYFFGAYFSYLSNKGYSKSVTDIKNFYSFINYKELEDYIVRKLSEYASSDASAPKTSIGQVRQYIDDHFTEPITMREIADQFAFSYSHLSRLFHEKVGMSFQEYLIFKRMNYAAELLCNPEMSIQEIACYVGYDNVFNFSRSFKKFHGISPNHYRNPQNSQKL